MSNIRHEHYSMKHPAPCIANCARHQVVLHPTTQTVNSSVRIQTRSPSTLVIHFQISTPQTLSKRYPTPCSAYSPKYGFTRPTPRPSRIPMPHVPFQFTRMPLREIQFALIPRISLVSWKYLMRLLPKAQPIRRRGVSTNQSAVVSHRLE